MALQSSSIRKDYGIDFNAVSNCVAAPAISAVQPGHVIERMNPDCGNTPFDYEVLHPPERSQSNRETIAGHSSGHMRGWRPPNLEKLKSAWEQGKWQNKFHLGPKEMGMVAKHGFNAISKSCRDIIRRRISNLQGVVDGRQTPMRGHPVFLAQHATGHMALIEFGHYKFSVLRKNW
eukprot:766249-Hanusia_phi.AAC.1